MTRKEKRRKAALVDFGQFLAVVIIMVGGMSAFMWVCFHGFAKVDCHNARQGLAFIERCEASENCTLRANELRLKEVYTRLEIKACPKD
jgi:hypothetical protein